MGLSRADFLTQRPEFSEVDTATVDAALAAALRRIDASVWLDLADDGQSLLAAHLLASSPTGNAAKLKVDGKPTTGYKVEYDGLVKQVACGIRSI